MTMGDENIFSGKCGAVVEDGQLQSGETKLPWYIRGKKKGRIRWLRHYREWRKNICSKLIQGKSERR